MALKEIHLYGFFSQAFNELGHGHNEVTCTGHQCTLAGYESLPILSCFLKQEHACDYLSTVSKCSWQYNSLFPPLCSFFHSFNCN